MKTLLEAMGFKNAGLTNTQGMQSLGGALGTEALKQSAYTQQAMSPTNTQLDMQLQLQKMYAQAQMQADAPAEIRRIQTMQDLDHAVFKTPIETLVTLWVARYGSDWVKKADVVGDDFFEWTILRLHSAGRLEEHRIASTMEIVLRIIDKTEG